VSGDSDFAIVGQGPTHQAFRYQYAASRRPIHPYRRLVQDIAMNDGAIFSYQLIVHSLPSSFANQRHPERSPLGAFLFIAATLRIEGARETQVCGNNAVPQTERPRSVTPDVDIGIHAEPTE